MTYKKLVDWRLITGNVFYYLSLYLINYKYSFRIWKGAAFCVVLYCFAYYVVLCSVMLKWISLLTFKNELLSSFLKMI